MKKALIIVDLQNDYFPGGNMELVGIEQAAKNARAALDLFRTKKLPIIHIQQHIQLVKVIDDNMGDTAADSSFYFFRRLVITGEVNPVRGKARYAGQFEFASRDHIEIKPFILDQLQHRPGGKGLGGVANGRFRIAPAELLLKSGALVT